MEGVEDIPGSAMVEGIKWEWTSFPEYLDALERTPHVLDMGNLMMIPPELRNPQHRPRAFLTNGAQGINLHRGTWHGVLTPLSAPGLFAVVDRIGTTPNLEEYRYTEPWTVLAP